MSEWIESYISALPKHRGILAQVKEKWKENSLNAFNRWRYSGSIEEWEYMKFCDLVVEALEKHWIVNT